MLQHVLAVMNVSFAAPTINVMEGAGIVSFTLLKTAGAVGPVSVRISTSGGTAEQGTVQGNELLLFDSSL